MKYTICPKCKTRTDELQCPKCGYNFAAASLGRKGGKSKSAAKRRSSRENGKLGGRPSLTKRNVS